MAVVHGGHFNASWYRDPSGAYCVRLEPKRLGGRLPRRGKLLDVSVARKGGGVQPMTVRVVSHTRAKDGRPLALAERYKDPRFASGRSRQ